MRTVMDEQRKLASDRAAYYDRMAQQLEARRFGPAPGDELIELGAAMMAPRSVRGFSGAMGNILPVLQRQSQARREGEQSRAEALNALQLATMQGRESALGQELATMMELEKLTAAGRKSPFSYQLSNTGEVKEVPKEAARPTTQEEYNAIPVGAYYVVPDGPNAGTVVRKTS